MNVNPKTGDVIFMSVIVFGIALVLLLVITFLKRRNKKDNKNKK